MKGKTPAKEETSRVEGETTGESSSRKRALKIFFVSCSSFWRLFGFDGSLVLRIFVCVEWWENEG